MGNGGRARGKHVARTGDGDASPDFFKRQPVDPDSPEGHKLGMSKRVQGAPSPIPGGKDHILNAPVYRQKPEAPNPADFTNDADQNAHGVPPATHTGVTRAQMMRGKLAEQMPDTYYSEARTPIRPVPVFIVENNDKGLVYRTAATRKVVVPINTGDPIQLCGRDPERTQILLLNEDATNGVRFAQAPGDLDNGGGALLPPAMGNYLRLITQDHLYAVGNTGTAATISIIQVFDTQGSGL